MRRKRTASPAGDISGIPRCCLTSGEMGDSCEMVQKWQTICREFQTGSTRERRWNCWKLNGRNLYLLSRPVLWFFFLVFILWMFRVLCILFLFPFPFVFWRCWFSSDFFYFVSNVFRCFNSILMCFLSQPDVWFWLFSFSISFCVFLLFAVSYSLPCCCTFRLVAIRGDGHKRSRELKSLLHLLQGSFKLMNIGLHAIPLQWHFLSVNFSSWCVFRTSQVIYSSSYLSRVTFNYYLLLLSCTIYF